MFVFMLFALLFISLLPFLMSLDFLWRWLMFNLMLLVFWFLLSSFFFYIFGTVFHVTGLHLDGGGDISADALAVIVDAVS